MTSGVPPLAAGFASKFDEIGPYIGFGSLVAVVAMAILVFAQGRELQRLREWAGTSPERLDALEAEVQRTAGVPPRSPAAPPRPGYVVPGAVPVAGATAATAAPGTPPSPPGTPGAAPGAPPAVPGAPGAPAAPGSPVVGAGAATPGGPPRPTPPRPTPPGTPGAPATRVLASSAAGGPRAATAAGAAASSRDRDRDRGGSDGPPRSIGQIIGVSVVGVVVLLALLFAFGVIGGGDEGPDRTPPGQEQGQTPGGTPTTTRPRTPRYPPTEMKTLVLNASGSGGLAKDVSDSIEEKFRFPMGEAANYNSIPGGTDTSAVTMIFYRAGQGESVSQNKTAAQDIARFLKLSPVGRYVKRMPETVKNGTAGQRVVLVVGADYARANPPTGTSSNGTATTPGAAGGTGTTTGSGGATGGTGSTDGTGGATTQPADPSGGTSQLTPNTDDLGTDPGVDDGTGGATVP